MAMAITANAAELTAKENAIVDIGAWTARGEQDKLGAAFKAGFDAGLTLNEAKELVGQLYAYCGFPRALNAAATLMKIEGYGLTRRRGDAENLRVMRDVSFFRSSMLINRNPTGNGNLICIS